MLVFGSLSRMELARNRIQAHPLYIIAECDLLQDYFREWIIWSRLVAPKLTHLRSGTNGSNSSNSKLLGARNESCGWISAGTKTIYTYGGAIKVAVF